jgi:hypothetical protein
MASFPSFASCASARSMIRRRSRPTHTCLSAPSSRGSFSPQVFRLSTRFTIPANSGRPSASARSWGECVSDDRHPPRQMEAPGFMSLIDRPSRAPESEVKVDGSDWSASALQSAQERCTKRPSSGGRRAAGIGSRRPRRSCSSPSAARRSRSPDRRPRQGMLQSPCHRDH